jgi:hypothetical protein
MRLLVCLFALGAGGTATAAAAAVPTVHVGGERLVLGSVVPSMPEPWASIDLGAAPRPLQRRLLTRRQIDARVRLAQLGSSPVALPSRIEVMRDGQVLTEPQLQRLVRTQVVRGLSMGSILRQLSLEGGLVLPRGKVSCQLPNLAALRAGRQTVLATIRSHVEGATPAQVQIPVLLDLEVLQQAPGLAQIERGQPVTILVQSGSVSVQSTGVAQLSGQVGDAIGVLPSGGTRVLHGRILDAQTVEVHP